MLYNFSNLSQYSNKLNISYGNVLSLCILSVCLCLVQLIIRTIVALVVNSTLVAIYMEMSYFSIFNQTQMGLALIDVQRIGYWKWVLAGLLPAPDLSTHCCQ